MMNLSTASRRATLVAAAALALSAPLAACASDDDEPATTTTVAEDTDTSEETATSEDTPDTTVDVDEADADEEASRDIGTRELLDFLLDEDAEIGALFDWDTGDGVIAITYLGSQQIGLYADTATEIDEAVATEACELASTFVFDRDPTAQITVYAGGYSDGTAVVTREGEAGTCTPNG